MAAVFSFSTYYLIQHKDRLTQVPTIVSLCLVTLVGILSVPVFGLAGFHVVLVARGRTTNEQVGLLISPSAFALPFFNWLDSIS